MPIRAPRDGERGTSGARAVTSAILFNAPALGMTSPRSDAHRAHVPGSSTISRPETAGPRASVDALQLRSLLIATFQIPTLILSIRARKLTRLGSFQLKDP